MSIQADEFSITSGSLQILGWPVVSTLFFGF